MRDIPVVSHPVYFVNLIPIIRYTYTMATARREKSDLRHKLINSPSTKISIDLISAGLLFIHTFERTHWAFNANHTFGQC